MIEEIPVKVGGITVGKARVWESSGDASFEIKYLKMIRLFVELRKTNPEVHFTISLV